MDSLDRIGARSLVELLDWRTGDVLFGRYQVEVIKRGGMGLVYVCTSSKTRQRLIIKIPNAPASVLRSMGRTADLLAAELLPWSRITYHPNVVQLIGPKSFTWLEINYQAPPDDVFAVPALLIEYGGDQNLAEFLRSADLNLADKARLLAEIAEGMRHTVSCGVVPHLDLKPQNVIVGSDGTARVTDFGIAGVDRAWGLPQPVVQDIAHLTRVTLDDGAGGTPPYMAPEQWRGRSACDERTDIYAFGIMAFELLAVAYPYVVDDVRSLEAWMQAHSKAHPRFELLPPHAGLESLIGRCLAKRMEDRFSNWTEVIDELAALGARAVGHAPRPSAARPDSRLDVMLFLGRAEEVRSIVEEAPRRLRKTRTYQVAKVVLASAKDRPLLALGRGLKSLILLRPVPIHVLIGVLTSTERMTRAALLMPPVCALILLAGLGRLVLSQNAMDTLVWPTIAFALFWPFLFLAGLLVLCKRCPNCTGRIRGVRVSPSLVTGTVDGSVSGTIGVCGRCGLHQLHAVAGQAVIKRLPLLQTLSDYEYFGLRVRRLRWRWEAPLPPRMRFGVGGRTTADPAASCPGNGQEGGR